MNTQLLHHLAHGDVSAKPDVRELSGDRVRFADGSEEAFDVIVYATGYRATLPVLDPGLIPLHDGATLPFLNVFPDQRGLFVIGLFETDGAAFPVVSRQAALVAALLRAEQDAPERAAWFHTLRTGRRPDLTGGVKYVHSPRHAIYVQFDEYLHYTSRLVKRMT
jgi:hypothetical protein